MGDFPYTTVTGKIKIFLDKAQQVGKPDSVDKKWLTTVGLKGANDTTLLRVFKFIGFITSDGKPTDRWLAYRDRTKAREVLADGIREGYRELFQYYHDADRRNDEELKSFFSTRIPHGPAVISATITTFRNLCALADFSKAPDPAISGNGHEATPIAPQSQGTPDTAGTLVRGFGPGVTVNINIQLAVPETTDKTIYEAFFAALKKNLLA